MGLKARERTLLLLSTLQVTTHTKSQHLYNRLPVSQSVIVIYCKYKKLFKISTNSPWLFDDDPKFFALEPQLFQHYSIVFWSSSWLTIKYFDMRPVQLLCNKWCKHSISFNPLCLIAKLCQRLANRKLFAHYIVCSPQATTNAGKFTVINLCTLNHRRLT